jgi:hypothetical protein
MMLQSLQLYSSSNFHFENINCNKGKADYFYSVAKGITSEIFYLLFKKEHYFSNFVPIGQNFSKGFMRPHPLFVLVMVLMYIDFLFVFSRRWL